ncbi:MAG: DNA polymerase III subunit delta [Treponema sp.]|uniref:DNA polymerase III subunit delta n=1 Tax=Treponema sp. TaxID=166 RepID=UPI00298D9C17|nr:DNA polymerase III subunit delta [Treponema sp.]MDD5810865.1 DNA polymerase III subunit delta [Treponema sp.]
MSIPVYLYTGPEFGERNDAVKALKADLKKKFGSFDDYLYYATDTSVPTVVSMLQSESLFTPATCVVYKSAELIKKKEDIEYLASWINSVTPNPKNKTPRDSAVLILVSDETSIDAKITKLIPKENQKIFWVMFENRRVPWLKDLFRKNGYSIEEDAAEMILEMVENNTESLKNECSRFFTLFPQGTCITSENVDSVLANTREESVFSLFGAMVDASQTQTKRLENSLTILQKLRLAAGTSGGSADAIVAGLTFCFRKLQVYHQLCRNGHPDDFTLKKNGISSPSMRTQYSNAAKLWTIGQTMAIISMLSSTVMNIRSSGTAMEESYLEMLIYSIIVKKGASIQTYQDFE